MPHLITSLANAHLKYARSLSQKKYRALHRQFTVEGTRLIEEATRAGLAPALVFLEPTTVERDARAKTLLSRLRAATAAIHPVTPDVLRALAETETPQGIVAVYPFPQIACPDYPQFLLILDSIRDPGNLGTILRTAWAAGVDAVYLAPGTADAYNPKVVRGAMGAHFFMSIQAAAWNEIARAVAAFCRNVSIPRVYLADARGEIEYTRVDWAPPRALIVGGEAEGASEHARRLATARISIPMPGRAESLNVAVAAGILLFAAVKRKT